ncbi:SDR family NAD(P)-dependent oxidoreductase [Vibrio sp. ZSDE26]|uniref:SDR family NAD(P)-dependent oxidoreductase n=1 Tax=Vibrio amylolyticus TaxID=2847292 RepID=A0A9X2BHQ3_9VIBR|nr:SDR family NAD(P)-dependent oxidoreductase [Vibrio amylolyticus]MCK6263255.1 SDR family NAD(P)-dependent oxidoreductase [Vibrio amylolyticus]
MRSVIITGCTSGLGKAFHDRAITVESTGTQYVFIGRALERVTKSESHVYCEINLSQNSQVDWDSVYHSGLPETLTFISNAGVIQPLGPITHENNKLFREAINVNLTSPVELISSLILWAEKYNIAVKIINVSSGAALRPIAGWGAYCMAKSGFRMFLDVLSKENEHVSVTHFDPGVINTHMQQSIRATSSQNVPSVESFRELAKNGKLRSPEDVAIELAEICDLLS